MSRVKVYTPQHMSRLVVTAAQNSKEGVTAQEIGLSVPQVREAIKANVIKPRTSKGRVVTRKTGKRGKPPVLYVPTIAARSMAKAA